MNSSRNNTLSRCILLGLSLCVIAAVFMFSKPGQNVLESAANLVAPRVAQSAIMPAEDTYNSFQAALENVIYLPHEVDLNAGSNYIAPEALQEKTESADITAMLGGQGHQCNFRDHISGAVALNGQGGCI